VDQTGEVYLALTHFGAGLFRSVDLTGELPRFAGHDDLALTHLKRGFLQNVLFYLFRALFFLRDSA
jgi:hypothetical protein